jgi:hypothetical protein
MVQVKVFSNQTEANEFLSRCQEDEIVDVKITANANTYFIMVIYK